MLIKGKDSHISHCIHLPSERSPVQFQLETHQIAFLTQSGMLFGVKLTTGCGDHLWEQPKVSI